jgi:hypothetical protein
VSDHLCSKTKGRLAINVIFELPERCAVVLRLRRKNSNHLKRLLRYVSD